MVAPSLFFRGLKRSNAHRRHFRRGGFAEGCTANEETDDEERRTSD
jgi:hypothetical protein